MKRFFFNIIHNPYGYFPHYVLHPLAVDLIVATLSFICPQPHAPSQMIEIKFVMIGATIRRNAGKLM